MINKIKDFLKNLLSRKGKEKQSSQEDFETPVNPENTGTYELSLKKQALKTTSENPLTSIRAKFTGLNFRNLSLPSKFKPSVGDSASSILSPSLSKSVENFLNRKSREPIHQISIVILFCAITYTLGKLTALSLRGKPNIPSASTYAVTIDLQKDFNPSVLNQVKSINIFRTNTVKGPGKKMADSKCEKAQQTSGLPIKLMNTIVLQDTIKSMASVQVRGDRELQEVREGDQIDNLAKIFKITRLEILVKNLESGICESISSDRATEATSPIAIMTPAASRQFKATKKMSGIDNVGNKFVISKALLDEKMKDIAAILTQARAIKIQNPDGTLSFKMTEMDPAGIFPYLGLQDQDIITSINGKPIYDINEVMGLFGRIKNLDNLQLGVKREGADSVQEYSIKK
jgi:type II secretion system protein C